MTALLLARTLLGRPLRTALLLAGFGVGVAVMIVLLAIASAISDQARGASARNAGDVVVLPVGIDVEALETGGATAYGYRIEHSRFLVRQLLDGPRFRSRIAAASPALADAVLYMRRAGAVGPAWQIFATGALPDPDRAVRGAAAPGAAVWPSTDADRRYAAPTEQELLAEIDALHQPPPAAESWAEWQYATVTAPSGDAYAYVSFLLGRGDSGAVSVQLGRLGRGVTRFVGAARARTALSAHPGPTGPADIVLGRSSFRLRGARYAVHLDFRDAATGRHVRGDVTLDPEPGFFLSPTEVRGDSGFVSGYVVPALRARVTGWIELAGAPRLLLDGWTGYHDHNWGTWAGVHWDWGEVSAPSGALIYGGISISAPALVAAAERRGPGGRGASPGLASYVAALFAGAGSAAGGGGLAGAFRPDSIAYEGWRVLHGVRAPGRVLVRATAGSDSLRAVLVVRDVTATPLRLGASAGDRLLFLQLHGDWSLNARAGGRRVDVSAPGAAETFIRSPR